MPHYPMLESAEVTLRTLAEALDVVDFGIVLLDRDLRACFINRRFEEIWDIDPTLLASAPTFRQILESAARAGWYQVPSSNLAAYLDEREAEMRAGSIPPTMIDLANRRHILFRSVACVDGSRILTYADISYELQREAAEAVARVTAELRFNSEVLEEQGAHLATLAEAAEENARKAEAARQLLEHEIAERRLLEQKLRRLATIDGLTGALNRAELLAAAERAMRAARQSRYDLAVLMLDVDHFKAINDLHGHAGGDCALQHLVTLLRAGIRQVDLLGRLGGEEFAIVLPGTPPAAAEQVAERLRLRIAETPTTFGGRVISMTVSIGLATHCESDCSIEQVIARADEALYGAKSAGRNQVVRHQQAHDLLPVIAVQAGTAHR